MKSIKEIDISKKRVLIRVDFNVPLDGDLRITDDTRIRRVLPTLKWALDQGVRLIVASHLGRPKGKVVDAFSLAPVAVRLGELLGREVRLAEDCIGDAVKNAVNRLAEGEVLLLQNLRFHSEEQKNDDAFAAKLASVCDVYINDAFAVSHRENASVHAIVRHVPVCGAGILLKQELDYFERVVKNPKRPLAAIIGGAKVSSKINALENMLQVVDKIIIGGAMANTFLKALGHDTGNSKVEEDMIEVAVRVKETAAEKGIGFYLPVDTIVVDRIEENASSIVVPVQEIGPGQMAVDIGPASSALFNAVLHNVQTIVWNGPMGIFEMDSFSGGTMAVAKSVAQSDALSVVGGGDTVAAVEKARVASDIGYISTGGGAFLKLMEGRSLPAVKAIQEAGR